MRGSRPSRGVRIETYAPITDIISIIASRPSRGVRIETVRTGSIRNETSEAYYYGRAPRGACGLKLVLLNLP